MTNWIKDEDMVRQMKVWVIGRSYPESGNNMSGLFELEQAKMLQKNGEDVYYLCGSFHPNKVIKAWGYQSWIEDEVTVCAYSRHFFPRVFPLYLLKFRSYLWGELFKRVCEENGQPDIIHIHYPALLMVADAIHPFHQMGVKIVVTEHWTKVLSKTMDGFEARAYRKYFEFIDACICVGSPLANAVKAIIGENKTPVYVVPNMVNQEFQPLYTSHDGFEFIAVGRLVKIKQFDQIIQAFSDCFRGKPANLTIVGGGEEHDVLEKLIVDLSVEKQVTLTGSLSRQQVAERIANADCLVCYSRFETFGVPIIEAWACGIPTITTTAAAVIDNFDNRLGVEVSYNDIDNLKEKMIYMYENIFSFDKKFISAYAKSNFSECAIYQQLKRIYMEG